MLMSACTGGGLTYLLTSATARFPVVDSRPAVPSKVAAVPCAQTTAWVRGFRLVRPLLSSGSVCESPRLSSLRASIGSMLDGLRTSGEITAASVYVRDMQQGDWTLCGGSEMYDPGSLMKIPVLLTYLAMADEIPGMLEKRWPCEAIDLEAPQQGIPATAQAQPGLSYTVADLLELMIVHSDNRATAVLLRHIPSGRFTRMFTDLGLEAPIQHGPTYLMNVRSFSAFMKALYNSSVLSPMRSEYALELMIRSRFMDGLMRGLPAGVEAAHKFGESVDASGFQLHETALVYAGQGTYLVTVMTKGTLPEVLPGVLTAISQRVYEHLNPPT